MWILFYTYIRIGFFNVYILTRAKVKNYKYPFIQTQPKIKQNPRNFPSIQSITQCQILLPIIFILVQSVIPSYSAESSTCLSVYNEGGAPAVLNSPKCPRWELSDHRPPPRNPKCQFAVRQGRRPYQEDRVICALDLRLPFPGKTLLPYKIMFMLWV